MIDSPFDEAPVVCGWPWHGQLDSVRLVPSWATVGVWLPNSRFHALPVEYARTVWGDCSYVFDMGLPDIEDPVIEAAGGAWWGRALLRSIPQGLYSAQESPDLYYGANQMPPMNPGPLYGVPLVIEPDDPEIPKFRVFCRASITANTLRIRVLHNGAVYQVDRPITLADIGQGAGQPPMAAFAYPEVGFLLYPAEITDAHPGVFRGVVRDFTGSKILLGIMARATTGAPGAKVPLSSESTGAPAEWDAAMWPLVGLVEVEILPAMFEDGTDPDDAVVLRLIEDRESALGAPLYEEDDEALPSSGRLYFARWTQTKGLLQAFYTDGEIQTIRYSRVQESNLHNRTGSDDIGSYRRQDAGRATLLQLYGVGDELIDEVELTENLTEIERGMGLQVIRTVTVTGEPDDVDDSGIVAGTAVWSEPLDVYMPGFHMFTPALTRYYIVGSTNILGEQDIRTAWIVAYANRMACLALTSDTYQTTAGLPMGIQMRALATPGGKVDTTIDVTEPKPLGYPNRRSLFLLKGFMHGSYNPVTGQHIRVTDSDSRRPTWV